MKRCPLCGAEPRDPEDFRVDLDSNLIQAGPRFLEVRPTLAEFAWLLRKAWPGAAHRERLMDGLYGTRSRDPPDLKVLDVYASLLRRALTGSGWTVLTAQRCGYRLARGEWLGVSRRRQELLDQTRSLYERNGRWPHARELWALGIYDTRQSFYCALQNLEKAGHLRRHRQGRQLIIELGQAAEPMETDKGKRT